MSGARQRLIQDARAAGFDAVEEFGGLIDIRLRHAETGQLIDGVRLYRNGTAYSHVSARGLHSYRDVRQALKLATTNGKATD